MSKVKKLIDKMFQEGKLKGDKLKNDLIKEADRREKILYEELKKKLIK